MDDRVNEGPLDPLVDPPISSPVRLLRDYGGHTLRGNWLTIVNQHVTIKNSKFNQVLLLQL